MNAPEAVISADSHLSETEECFLDIDPSYRETRPKAIHDERVGALLHDNAAALYGL